MVEHLWDQISQVQVLQEEEVVQVLLEEMV
jgi:hypothetical protein